MKLNPLLLTQNFWDDYPDISQSWGQIQNKGNFLLKFSQVMNFIIEICRYVWMIALLVSVIAFVMAAAAMAVHADDNPYMKDHAKHDLWASMVSIVILSCIGLIWTLIATYVFK